MSARLDEIEKTGFHSHILGHKDQLVQPRPHKTRPTHDELAERLVQFNHSRAPEFWQQSIVITKTVTSIEYTFTPTPEELAAARKRLDARDAQRAQIAAEGGAR